MSARLGEKEKPTRCLSRAPPLKGRLLGWTEWRSGPGVHLGRPSHESEETVRSRVSFSFFFIYSCETEVVGKVHRGSEELKIVSYFYTSSDLASHPRHRQRHANKRERSVL